MQFPNGMRVQTPEGCGVVVNADRQNERDVQFRDPEAGTRVASFPIDQLQHAPEPNLKALQGEASRAIGEQIKKHAPDETALVQKIFGK